MWPFRRAKNKNGESAKKAVREAEQHVVEAHEGTPEIRQISSDLRELRYQNHFAQQLQEIIIQRRGTAR